MGTIFGSNGDRLFHPGDTSFFDRSSGENDRIYHSGNMAFGEDNMYTGGSVSSFGNHRIFSCGNTYECDGNRYTRVGNTLFGPNGERWYGDDMSDGDIRDIISHNRS